MLQSIKQIVYYTVGVWNIGDDQLTIWQTKIDFSVTDGSHSEGNNITINPSQVESMTNGTSADMNPLTSSYGMVALHEFRHTFSGGGLHHGNLTMNNFGFIDLPDVIRNNIRQEMSVVY